MPTPSPTFRPSLSFFWDVSVLVASAIADVEADVGLTVTVHVQYDPGHWALSSKGSEY